MNAIRLHYNLRNRRSFKRRSIELRWLICRIDTKAGKVSIAGRNKAGKLHFHDIMVGDRS